MENSSFPANSQAFTTDFKSSESPVDFDFVQREELKAIRERRKAIHEQISERLRNAAVQLQADLNEVINKSNHIGKEIYRVDKEIEATENPTQKKDLQEQRCRLEEQKSHQNEEEIRLRSMAKTLEERQRLAGTHVNETQREDTETSPRNDLVGLALSGGGLRSAMFNLGFLQALEKAGFMQFVDYLSTVSGGGYVGGFYSTCGHQASTDELKTAHLAVDSVESRDTVSRIPRFTKAAHRFINAGQYLKQPWAFLAGYLLPFALVFFLFFSGLVAAASTVALFFRLFDFPRVGEHLAVMGFDSELSILCVAIALFWLVLMVISWGVRWVTRSEGSGTSSCRWGRFYESSLKLLVVAVLCGIAIMFGNYDFGLVSGESVQLKGDAQIPLAIISVLGLMALFRLPLLLRSDHMMATLWQKASLWCILSATVGCSSMAILIYVGSEGISGYSQFRGPQLDSEDIVNDRQFAHLLKSTRIITYDTLVSTYLEAIAKLDDQKSVLFPDTLEYRYEPRTLLHGDDFSRFGRYVLSFLEGKDHPITQLLAQEVEVRKQRDTLVGHLNKDLLPNLNPDSKSGEHVRQLESVRAMQNGICPEQTNDLLSKFSSRIQESKKRAEPVDTYKNIETYLNSATNHARKPLLGKAALLRSLAPLIDPDGQLVYQPESLDAAAELVFRRQLLEATYPHVFKQREFISTPVVVGHDQITRLWILGISLLTFIILCIWVDFNRHAAVFHYYRERIARTFIEAGSPNRSEADTYLSRFEPWQKGFPYPLFSAALKLPQSVDINRLSPRELGDNPAKVDGSVGSEWYSFLLSPKFVGYLPVIPGRRPTVEQDLSNTADDREANFNATSMKTYRSTNQYLADGLKVSDAATLSGAAVTPWMSNNSALNLLMHVFNLRLEQWLPNPSSHICLSEDRGIGLFGILREALRCSSREGLKSWHWGIVADGGFREFLGVEELIARRCRIIVVSDAGCNNGVSEFGVLADLIRQMRLDHDVRILDLDHDLPLDTDRIRRTKDGQGIQHFIAGRIRYPGIHKEESLYDRTGLFIYVQMSLTGDEDVDLAQFQKIHPTFPDEPITNQFFSAEQVESLRQLGEHVGRHLCQRLNVWNVLESEASDHRTERLADALVGSYLVECRQEQSISLDDTPPDIPLMMEPLAPRAIHAFNAYEARGERGRELAHYVTTVIDGYNAEVSVTESQKRKKEMENELNESSNLVKRIRPEDLSALAVECNRRHVGFRMENPNRYFRIGGRRLLLRATSRAIEFVNQTNNDDPTNDLIVAVARLAALIPEGIFRMHGVETSRDLTLCVLTWFCDKFEKLKNVLDTSINRAVFRRGLEMAIRTGMASEIEEFLRDIIIRKLDSHSSVATHLSLGKSEPTSEILLGQPYNSAPDTPNFGGNDSSNSQTTKEASKTKRLPK